MNKAKTEIT